MKKAKRIAILSIMQESNTFSPLGTEIDDFEVVDASDIIKTFRGTRTEIGGMIDTLDTEKREAVPIITAAALPSGIVSASAFDDLRDTVVDRLKQAKDIDGILIVLHGAMVAENAVDADGALLRDIRRAIGDFIPMVVTLDLHANLTKLMLENADMITGYKTYPHIDLYETGARAAQSIISIIDEANGRPLMVMEKLPMIIPAENMQTTSGPMAKIMALVNELEKKAGIWEISIFPVQPWLDVPEMGFGVLAVTDGNRQLGEYVCVEVAQLAWDLRNDFLVVNTPVEQAIERALSTSGGPVVLSESADSTTGGAPGDSTVVLEALLKADLRGLAFVTVVDPEAVEAACKSGVGSNVTLNVGGKLSRNYCRPIKLSGTARLLPDAIFSLKDVPVGCLVKADMGRTIVLSSGNVRVVITSKRVPTHDPNLYKSVGLEPQDAKIVVVKSPNLFRIGYGSFAKDIIIVDTPGVCTCRLESLEYRNVQRPIFPLDDVSDLN